MLEQKHDDDFAAEVRACEALWNDVKTIGGECKS